MGVGLAMLRVWSPVRRDSGLSMMGSKRRVKGLESWGLGGWVGGWVG